MSVSQRVARRHRYAHRPHEVATRPVPLAAPVPAEISWKVAPGGTVAHAFSTGPGFMRSVCRAERWTVLWHDAPRIPRCFECADLVAGEIPELELRAMDGNR